MDTNRGGVYDFSLSANYFFFIFKTKQEFSHCGHLFITCVVRILSGPSAEQTFLQEKKASPPGPGYPMVPRLNFPCS